MARKRITNAEGASMDSLMDTLTNVVGILVIVLILAQLNASRQVKRILSDLPPATEAELRQVQAGLQASQKELELTEAEVKSRRAQASVTAANQAAARAEAERLRGELKRARQNEPDLQSLLASLRDQERKLQDTRKAVDGLMAEREKLEAQLASTPENKGPGPKMVRIPAAKPLPENGRIERFFVTRNRVHYLENLQAVAAIEREIVQARRELERDVIRDKGKPPRVIYDQQKIVDRFASRAPKPRDVEVSVPANRPWTRLYVLFKPRVDAGEDGEKAGLATSRFQNLLRGFGGNTIVYFHVTPDSFETYLALREWVERRNLSAGWDIQSRAEFRHTMQEIEVNRLEEPPKPVPSASPSIPAPKKTLD